MNFTRNFQAKYDIARFTLNVRKVLKTDLYNITCHFSIFQKKDYCILVNTTVNITCYSKVSVSFKNSISGKLFDLKRQQKLKIYLLATNILGVSSTEVFESSKNVCKSILILEYETCNHKKLVVENETV